MPTYYQDWERLQKSTGARIPDEVQKQVEEEWERMVQIRRAKYSSTFSVYARIRSVEIATGKLAREQPQVLADTLAAKLVSEMTADELEALLTAAQARKAEIAAAERLVAPKERKIEALRAKRAALDTEIADLEAEIEALRRGELPEAKGEKAPRAVTDRTKRGGNKGEWSPERRKKSAQNAIRMLAKRYGWPAERLASKLAELDNRECA